MPKKNSDSWFEFFKRSSPIKWGAAAAATGVSLSLAGSAAFAHFCYQVCSEDFAEFKTIREVDLHNVWANISVDNGSFFTFNLSQAEIPLPPFAIKLLHRLADTPEYCFAFSLGLSLFASVFLALQFANCVTIWKLAREQAKQQATPTSPFDSDSEEEDEEYKHRAN